MNWPVGRRASQPANTSFFRPGRFSSNTEMNQPQAPMSSPSAGVPMAVYDRPPEKRSTNAQLSSSTPIQSDAPMQPQVMGQPKAPADPLFAWAISQGRDPNDPQTKALFLRSQAPEQANPGDMTTPAPQRYGGPPGGKAPDFASLMQQKAMSGQLTMQDVLQARQMGEDGLAVAMLQALAGNGWNYTPSPRSTAAGQPQAPAGVNMGFYDRSGAGPGIGATPDPVFQREATPDYGTGRRYTTRIPGASKGVYTG